MSLKLCCALPVTLNCLKSARILFLAPEFVKAGRNPVKQTNFCYTIQQSRWFSSGKINKDSNQKNETPETPYKKIYDGPLAPHVKAVKLFSVSSSVVGLTAQPFLYSAIVQTGNVPIILAAYSFIGFFTVLTPLLLHIITKKYITELSYNEKTDTYIAKSLNFFCAKKETKFKVEDVYVPDVPGMFVTFHIKGKPLFVDPRNFEHPDHYAKLMGFDKPMDFKLFENQIPSVTKSDSTSSPNTSSSSTNK